MRQVLVPAFATMHRHQVPTRHRLAALSLAAGMTMMVAACSGPPAPAPGPGPATSIPTATGGGTATAPESVGATTVPNVTLDQLFTRIQAGWAGESRFREVTSFTTDGSTPGAGSSTTTTNTGRTLREVFGPGAVRAAAEENDHLLYEMLISGEDIYLRGTLATLIDPSLPAGEWLRTERSVVAAHPQLGESLLGPMLLDVPTYRPPDRLLPQVVRAVGPTADGCFAYAAADTTATGARVDLTIAVQADGALCQIDTRSSGLASTYQVEPLRADAAIALPATFREASPGAGSPPASPLATD